MKSPKLTGQQEIFAREYVRLGSASAAYRIAYRVRQNTLPETIWQASCRVRQNSKVAARIEELTRLAAERALVTRETMLVEMAQNREFALLHENPSAAQSSSRDRAKLAGLLKEGLELTGKDGGAVLVEEQISDETRNAYDFARRIAWLLAQGRLALGGPAPVVDNNGNGD